MLRKWKIVSSSWALDEKWFKVRKDVVEIAPGKIIDDYFVSIFPDIVMTIALTEDGLVPLVRQYKHGVGDLITELPAGAVDEGEDPLVAAKRELKEETGFIAASWEKIGQLVRNPAKSEGNLLHVYLARGAEKTGEQRLDENENIEVMMKPYAEVLAMAKSGELQGADTVVALLLSEGKVSSI